MTGKRLGIIAVFVIAALVVAGGAWRILWTGSSGGEAKSVSLRLAWVYDMAEVGIFVADRKGYFREEGLNVKIEPGGFGLDPIKPVAAGTNDFGVGGAGNLLLARAQGVPVVAFGAFGPIA